MNGLSIIETLKYAIAMSIITITHEDTINPAISNEYVKNYMNKMTWK